MFSLNEIKFFNIELHYHGKYLVKKVVCDHKLFLIESLSMMRKQVVLYFDIDIAYTQEGLCRNQ